MRAHIDSVAAEFPTLEPIVIERIYQHLVVVQLRQPTRQEFRAYVAELTTSLVEATLRGLLGLPPKTSAGATDGRHGTATQAVGVAGHATRRSGRPGWTTELFWARYREACERTTPPHTHRTVAQEFQALHGDRGIDPEYLRKLLRRYGPPPA